ncbi:MAG TPA: dihydrodipicolinate synthase family protein [Acidobacteriaceae bacterium]|nr:dihydrodipicolinate synthase family protein [Acidobacteriaceae bacterium]
MDQKDWAGIFPAITTPFRSDLSVDYETFAAQARWMVECGCSGIVALGSLGESPALTREEKIQLLQKAVQALKGTALVIAGIAALSTAEAVSLAKEASRVGIDGLMVLPPQIYRSDWRETQAHLSAVFEATPLSCMLYNNPIAYGTDITPEQMIELRARHPNLHAVKESSGDIRRITSLRHLAAESLEIFVGMDDVVVESLAAGATGWIAGLVNAFPEESVRLFRLAKNGPSPELEALYAWFLPLLRLDTVPKFVQLIKLVQEESGGPPARVRPPRLEVIGAERDEVVALTRRSLANRPH